MTTRRIRTKSIATWDTQRSGKARRDLINRARDLVATERLGGEPAPTFLNVPDDLAPPRAKAGRKRIAPISVSVTMTQAHHDKAKALGNGNISAGVRTALESQE